MRNPEEQALALECLKQATDSSPCGEEPERVVKRAEAYYAFVTGDESAERLAAVRAVLKDR